MDHLIIILILYYDQWIIYIFINEQSIFIHIHVQRSQEKWYPLGFLLQPIGRDVLGWSDSCSHLGADLREIAKTATTKAASS